MADHEADLSKAGPELGFEPEPETEKPQNSTQQPPAEAESAKTAPQPSWKADRLDPANAEAVSPEHDGGPQPQVPERHAGGAEVPDNVFVAPHFEAPEATAQGEAGSSAPGTPDPHARAEQPAAADDPVDVLEDHEESAAPDTPSHHAKAKEPAPADDPVGNLEDHEEAAEPGTAPERPQYMPVMAAAEQTKPRSLFLALAATAIAGSLLGLGGSFTLHHFESSRTGNFVSEDQISAVNARLDAIEGKADAAASVRNSLAALEARVAAAESTANKAADSANLAEADLQKQLAAPPPPEQAAAPTPSKAPDLAPLNARIGTIEQKVTSLEGALAAPKAELRAAPEDRETPAGKPGSSAQATAIIAQSLVHKLETDAPFTDELAALEHLGATAETLGPLQAVSASPSTSEHQLAAQFAELAPEIIASDPANQPGTGEGFLDRVTRHAKGLVHVRRVGEGEDSDTEGLVSRIEKALTDHDLDTAYTLWKTLPSAAIAKSESWGQAVKARLDALNAARSIENDAVAALGRSKS